MTTTSKVMGLLMGVMLTLTAHGETSLTWPACVSLTAAHNPALIAAQARIEASAAGIKVARSSLFPQLALGASANRSYRDTAEDDSQSSYNASVSVAQSLYSGGKNQAGVRSAQSALDNTLASAVGTRAQITFDLRAAFVDLLVAQEQVQLLRQIEQRRSDNLELVDLRYEGGREHKGSLALSQASFFDARMQVKQAERLVKVNQEVLQRIMGWSGGSNPVAVAGNLESAQASDRDDLETLARKTPAFKEAETALASARTQVEIARGGFRPELDLTGSAGRSGEDSSWDDDQLSVGLSLTFPLWPGGRNSHELRKALAGVSESEAHLAEVVDREVRSLAEAQQSFANSVENVAVQKEYVSAADLRADIARRQYEDGLLTFENWSLIEDDRVSRQKQFLDAEKAALRAEAAWWMTIGRDAFAETSSGSEGVE